MKFTKEQIDYAKHCVEHAEFLTGGRGQSKTKQIIEQLQNNWNELKKYISEQLQYYSLCEDDYKEFNILDSIESKMQELEEGKDE